MELFVMNKHQHQPAPAMVLVLDTTSFRNSSAAQGKWPASPRRAAAATQWSARRSRAARPSQRARTAATTGGASEHDSGALPARESLSSYLIYLYRVCRL